MFSIGEILDLAIRLERNGEKAYRDALQNGQDPPISDLLVQLAEDEQRHAEWFAALKEEWKSSEASPFEDMETAVFREIFGTQTFSLGEADFAHLEDRNDLLKFAIEFEKDSIAFYQMLQSLISDFDTSRQMGRILEEERKHVQALEALLP